VTAVPSDHRAIERSGDRAIWLTGAVVLFITLATANSAGYRYGVSDQAYYVPAVAKVLDPALFPRDAPLLAAQSRLTFSAEAVAGLSRLLHLDLPVLCFGLYVLTLVTLCGGAVALAESLGFSRAATAAFLLLLSLRHRIARTGANTLEGYMHPRQLAFALGVVALAAFARRRHGVMTIALALAAALHPTTALWFAVLLGPACFIARPAWRRPLLAVAALALLAGVAVITRGPLASHLAVMDRAWLDVLADKDYLFPADWPLYAWAANLAYLPVILGIYASRRAAGVARPEERGIVIGLGALVAVFLVSVPLVSAHVALAVQLQVSRVFWWLDFVAAAYAAWWLTSSPWWRRLGAASTIVRRAVPLVLVILVLASAGRGYYAMHLDNPGRPLARIALPDTPWIDAMTWLRHQPGSWHVLADPAHAWKYGVSVRVGAERDVLLESVKDSALALYDRDAAMRVADRQAALSSFGQFTMADMRALAARYRLDVLVIDAARAFDAPVLYRNAGFVVYDLR
jgi:hypothetical protein